MARENTNYVKNNRKWRETHRNKANYLSARSTARSFIRSKALDADLLELEILIQERRKQLSEEDILPA